MKKNIEILGLILARGGSKGIPDKNITDFCGKPLIAWTIDAAKKSRFLSRIAVSTDSLKIAKVAKKYGAEIPFLRPKELASDKSPSDESIVHALRWYEEHEGYVPEFLMLLQPTSPLRTAEDIDNCVRLLIKKNGKVDGVVSVKEAQEHPLWMKKINSEGLVENAIKNAKVPTQRQQLPPLYSLNGAVYLVKTDCFLNGKRLIPKKTAAYVMPRERSVDIDDVVDLAMAQCLYKKFLSKV
ncbi:MAG: acylneuraminate cytidylyltransferase family protein [Candidatus Omnitrophica bacterium]|nr:acylneuraminate cytidylyltransferase family protein [Candidatus Omnitrophota bacterium]